MSAKIITPIHPYFPEGVTLSGNEFVPNNLNAGELILRFGAVWATILAVACAMARKINPRLSGTDQVLVLWFVLCESFRP
jgi:cholestenol delta-isomerase